jgi:hypothetical protein
MMGIRLRSTETGGYSVRVTCDQCGTPIENARKAVFQYQIKTGGDISDRVPGGAIYFLHKACLDQFEGNLVPRDGMRWAFSELAVFPLRVAASIGMTWEDMGEAARHAVVT